MIICIIMCYVSGRVINISLLVPSSQFYKKNRAGASWREANTFSSSLGERELSVELLRLAFERQDIDITPEIAPPKSTICNSAHYNAH